MSARQDLLKSRRGVDVILTTAVAIAASVVSYRALAASYRVAPAIEDLFVACTGRPGWMPDPSRVYTLPEWTAFLERKIAYFPCEAINGIPLLEVGITWDLQRYFHLALSTWFRIVGPTVNGFITFQAASYAITSGLAYLIFRLGMGRIPALACAAGFALSTSHLAMAGLPIEYSKAPWVLGVVLLCGVIVLRDAAGKSLGWAAAGLGLVAGVGIGFKPDLIAVVPLAVLTPVVFVGAWNAGGLTRKVTAALLVIAGVAAGGGEMLYDNFFAPTTGSLLPIQVLGGQDWQTESLHASSPLYDYSITWDDSHVTWLINSYGQRVLGKTTISGFFSREMEEVASRLVVDLWTTFPGDLVLRVIAATTRVLRLNGLGLYGSLAGVFVVFAWNRRQGWFAAFAIAYLCAYVSLVFQRRHIFHLEFVSWFLGGVLAQFIVTAAVEFVTAFRDGHMASALTMARARLLKPALGAVMCLTSIAAGWWVLLSIARAHQQTEMIRLVETYRAAPRDHRLMSATPDGAGQVLVRIDGLSLRDRAGAPDTVASDYLAVSFRCPAPGIIHVKSRYLPPVVDWNNWNRDFGLICAEAGGESTLMMPVYQYGTDYRFDGLVMNSADADNIVSVSTIPPDPGVRLWLNLLVPADWKIRVWVERMRSPPVMPV